MLHIPHGFLKTPIWGWKVALSGEKRVKIKWIRKFESESKPQYLVFSDCWKAKNTIYHDYNKVVYYINSKQSIIQQFLCTQHTNKQQEWPLVSILWIRVGSERPFNPTTVRLGLIGRLYCARLLNPILIKAFWGKWKESRKSEHV